MLMARMTFAAGDWCQLRPRFYSDKSARWLVVRRVIAGVRRIIVTLGAVPLSLFMTRRGTISGDGVILDPPKLDGTRTIVQIMLVFSVTIVIPGFLLLHMQGMRPCCRRVEVTCGTIRPPGSRIGMTFDVATGSALRIKISIHREVSHD